jgi:hypothetical protein
VVIGRAACLAATGAYSFLPPKHALMKLPRQVFYYALDIKARSFAHEAYVNVSDVLFDMLTLNNIFDELYSTSPLWPNMMKRVTVTDHHNQDRTVTLNAQSEAILARSVASNARTLELAQVRYRVGSGDLRAVLQQNVALYGARTALLHVQTERLVQRVNLHLALGGSFVEGARGDTVGSAPEPARAPEIADARAVGYRSP